MKIDFTRSTVEGYSKRPETILNLFKEKIDVKIPQEPKTAVPSFRHKNPEEDPSKLDFKKAKNSFYTPK